MFRVIIGAPICFLISTDKETVLLQIFFGHPSGERVVISALTILANLGFIASVAYCLAQIDVTHQYV